MRYALPALLTLALAIITGCDHPPQSACCAPDPTPATATTAPSKASSAVRVTIDNFTYAPATITVAPGTTVTWTNRDDVPHTVTADDKSFNSKALDTDETYSHTFTAPGTYPYFCAVHTHMTGQVVVK